MISLSPIERDAIGEAFNLGMGAAGNALSEMLGKEVLLSVPEVSIEKRVAAVADTMGISPSNRPGGEQSFGCGEIIGVREEFSGPFNGSALLLFPEQRSLDLVRLLLQQPELDADTLSEMEQEALVEVANIILNACLGAIAKIVGEEIINEIPEAMRGTIDEIVSDTGGGRIKEFVMKLNMHFRVDEVHIDGNIAFIMDIHSLDLFRNKLAEYFDFGAA